MFAAAMLYSCPNLELSIYSTCKRISQKLLRNVVKFLDLIHLELRTRPFVRLRMNQVFTAYPKVYQRLPPLLPLVAPDFV